MWNPCGIKALFIVSHDVGEKRNVMLWIIKYAERLCVLEVPHDNTFHQTIPCPRQAKKLRQ